VRHEPLGRPAGAVTKAVIVSTEPIATQPVQAEGGCRACGAPLAADQRYCLECGERAGAPRGSQTVPLAPPAPPLEAGGQTSASPAHAAAETPRVGTATLLAGVGVLLLAMGVGVLIGRSAAGKTTAAPAQVISVPAASGAGAQNTTGAESSFAGDWPAGTDGYTVKLQALPQAGTTPAAVQAAKAAAIAKGAKNVGALKSSSFASLKPGNYIVYSGVFHGKAAAQRALPSLRKAFPAAAVIHVAQSGSGAGAAGAAGSRSGVGKDFKHPAPPTVLQNLNKSKGQSYEQRSRNLPDVISTG